MNKVRTHSKFENTEIIRISVSNLVSDINGKLIGIINKEGLKRGQKNVSLAGGKALLFNRKIIESLGGFDFEKDEACFRIAEEKSSEAISLFTVRDPSLYEIDVNRELKQEFAEEIIGNMSEPILSPDECDQLTTDYRGVSFYDGYGMTEAREIITKYVWHLFSLNGPDPIMKKLQANKMVHIIENEDLLIGKTSDGFRIAQNTYNAKALLIESKNK
ncbi:MAG: hypothetical protein PHS92_00805 [Candidatus Gracilibacteria bacterium]|nr:hypothetical protein [Candidatus Gracilibacteria bacterium]